MVSGTRPTTGPEERIPVSGPIKLIFEDRALTISGELKDVSLSGLRVEYGCALIQPGVVARIQYASRQKKARIIWVRSIGERFQAGLLHQETYLISRALAGDDTAFAELVNPYLHNLRLAILSMLHNTADAEEAMQEALLKVTLHLNQFRTGNDFKPWLYRIATREALKRLRWNRRHTHDLRQMEDEDGKSAQNVLETIVDPAGTPAEVLERKEFAAAVSIALESVSEKYRQIFIACDLHQVPVTVAARRLGINIDTANTRLHRARLLMRTKLQKLDRRTKFPGGQQAAN
jgi:RNA polymerase sigma-70 factor (ECF subfamily)